MTASARRTHDPAPLRLIDGLSTVCGVIASAMIVASVAITVQLIFVRFVLNRSTIWQTEAVIYLMIGATLIGLPYVQRLRGHVNVDLVPLMLPPPVRRALAVVVLTLTIVVAAVMLFYGFEMWHFAWSRGWRSDTVWGPPLWIPYLALPIGFGVFLLQLCADMWRTLTESDASALTTSDASTLRVRDGER